MRRHSAFAIERGESCLLASRDGMELLIVALPLLAGDAGRRASH